MKEILIIGGGASGIAAALSARQTDSAARITILEQLDRVGKKILATGNGHCNLTNEDMSSVHFHSTQPARMEQLLADMLTERVLAWFEQLGLLCAADSAGRIYPYCRQASMVLDILLQALRRADIRICCNCTVTAVQPHKKGYFAITDSGERYFGHTVILTTGGKAAPKQGSNGLGYPLVQAFGHSCTDLFPCLVPIKCKSPVLKGLKGIRVQAELSLLLHGKKTAAEYGELQLTDYGVSGIPAMQLSCFLNSKAMTQAPELQIDFFPAYSFEALRQMLQQRVKAYPQEPFEELLYGLLNKRVNYALLRTVNIDATAPASRISRAQLDQLISVFKKWRLPITETLGWEQAQVTGGGVPLAEIDDSFQSKKAKGLYLAGELLDIAGDCGGYNLHWAWCSGITAGQAAAQI